MKYLAAFTIIIILCYSCDVPNQSESILNESGVLDAAYVASKTDYFSIVDDVLVGSGKELLTEVISKSQFFVLGERHGSVATCDLTNALIPLLDQSGFDVFAMEVGPHSAKVLDRLVNPPDKAIDKLRAFNSKYYIDEVGGDPIPFYSGIEDAHFIQTAAKYKMDFWGLDQEFYYAAPFLMDELLELKTADPEFDTIEMKKNAAVQTIRDWYLKEEQEEEVDVFKEFLRSKSISEYFDVFVNDPEGMEIIKDLRLSWDIYARWRNGSHADRISYMRNNFVEHYNDRVDNGKTPKVFLKFGQVHTAQNVSLGTYDLGNLMEEIASKNNTYAANFNSWTRYYKEDGKVEDYFETNPSWFRRYESFIVQGRQDQWTIINLEAIRNDIANGVITLPNDGSYHKIRSLIEGYDFQFILPVDQYVTPNME